jgi:hypothetical protein
VKDGGLSLNSLAVFGDVLMSGTTSVTQINVSYFCNADGSICATLDELLASDGGVASSPLLHGELHTEDQCTATGGTVIDAGGVNVCQFEGASCPAGWMQYDSWSSTASRTCTGGRCGYTASQCTTGQHTWADRGLETCSYRVYTRCGDSPEHYTATCSATRTQIGCL